MPTLTLPSLMNNVKPFARCTSPPLSRRPARPSGLYVSITNGVCVVMDVVGRVITATVPEEVRKELEAVIRGYVEGHVEL